MNRLIICNALSIWLSGRRYMHLLPCNFRPNTQPILLSLNPVVGGHRLRLWCVARGFHGSKSYLVCNGGGRMRRRALAHVKSCCLRVHKESVRGCVRHTVLIVPESRSPFCTTSRQVWDDVNKDPKDPVESRPFVLTFWRDETFDGI